MFQGRNFRNILVLVALCAIGYLAGHLVHQGRAVWTDLSGRDVNKEISTYWKSPVVLLGTASCPYCKRGREFLVRKGVKWSDVDVDTSPVGKMQFESLNETSVPILIVGDRRLVGFDENRWHLALSGEVVP